MPTQSTSPHLPFGENKQADWYGKDIISVKQFGRDDLEYIFGVAHEMRGMVERVGTFDLLKGKILANLLYEPSTRTSSSFTAAMERLGGSVIPINEVKYSSRQGMAAGQRPLGQEQNAMRDTTTPVYAIVRKDNLIHSVVFSLDAAIANAEKLAEVSHISKVDRGGSQIVWTPRS